MLLRGPTSPWLPSEWAAQGIMTWLRDDPEILHFYLLWSTAAVAIVLGALLHRALYARGLVNHRRVASDGCARGQWDASLRACSHRGV